MASFKSKIFNFLLRNTHLSRGQLHKEVFNMSTSIQGFRDRCEKGAERLAKLPANITVHPINIDDVQTEWLVPKGAPDNKIIMYVHGGGYVSGSCNDHRAIVSKFAKNCGIKTLTYEYRLAPEHKFPAALDDSIVVYNWLLKNYKSENIIIAGESAGGGLTLAILLALKEKNMPMPAAAVAISPWTDLACLGESYKTKNRKSPAPLNSWFVFSEHYVGDNNSKNPLISPLYGDLAGLPPLLINSGVDDELFDDGEQFYLKAKQAGVNVIFKKGLGMVHCYPLLAPMFPEATEAMNEIVEFIRMHLEIHD